MEGLKSHVEGFECEGRVGSPGVMREEVWRCVWKESCLEGDFTVRKVPSLASQVE